MSIRRALLSVSNKDGLLEFAQALHKRGVAMLSTGGTATLLERAGVPVTQVSSHTGFPEIMDGRVKTLHPKIHGGLLGRRNVDDAVMRHHGIEPIDLLVVNLYPFAATIAKPGCTYEEAIENIDIGGPAMVRAAAKNHDRVAVIVDPADYATVLDELQSSDGALSEATRKRLAAKAFAHTASYDSAVASYLAPVSDDIGKFPQSVVLQFQKLMELRYGENPHQDAAFYRVAHAQGASIGSAKQLQGRTLSYNNIADGDTAFECVRQFADPACVIVKHANPCGVALASDVLSAYDRAHKTDPTSAYGGIIAFNRTLTAETARAILDRQFVELIIAPEVDAEALELCKRKENVRVLVTDGLAPSNTRYEYRSVNGGLLVQTRDQGMVGKADLKVVTKRQPTALELDDLLFAWQVCKYVKSNAIVYARFADGHGQTVGIGAGQMSRVDSARVARLKAEDTAHTNGWREPKTIGSVCASDAFFPFPDGVEQAAAAGVTAIIQPGGSVRDALVIEAANRHGMAMVMTGRRQFRH